MAKIKPSHARKFWQPPVAFGIPYTIQDANKEFGKYSTDPLAFRLALATMNQCSILVSDKEAFKAGKMVIGG